MSMSAQFLVDMLRKPTPRGATPLALPVTPLHRRPYLWVVGVGALLMILGLSLTTPNSDEQPSMAVGEVEAALAAPSPDVVAEPIAPPVPTPAPEPPWQEFVVQDGDNLSLIFNRAGFSDTDL